MNLKGRDFLKLLDYSSEEIRYLLDVAKKFKKLKSKKIDLEFEHFKNIADVEKQISALIG